MQTYSEKVKEFNEVATPSNVLFAGIGVILVALLVVGSFRVAQLSFDGYKDVPAIYQTATK
jgi:hypothetical protein